MSALVACEFCDRLHRARALARGEKAMCVRCGARLYGSEDDSLQRTLALNVAALALFGVANTAFFLHVSLEGQTQSNRIYTGVGDLIHFDFHSLGLLIFFTTLMSPLVKILVTLYAVSAAMLRKRLPGVALAMRTAEALSTWAMLDVYLLAVIVAVVKLSMMATVQLQTGAYAFFALILVLAAARSALEPEAVWSRLRQGAASEGAAGAQSAAAAGLIRCSGCEMLSRSVRLPRGAVARCRGCGTRLHVRKPESLQRTWALVITAYLLYIPANVLPVMYVGRLGQQQGDTILTGVQTMFAAGWWVVGSLIFFASITVPLAKLVVLTLLLISVTRKTQKRPRQRTLLYRIVEAIGRWSMLDMFVVSLTVALVQLGAVANVTPGPGATWFAGVVVITMLAAMSFDPRLIWDRFEEEHA